MLMEHCMAEFDEGVEFPFLYVFPPDVWVTLLLLALCFNKNKFYKLNLLIFTTLIIYLYLFCRIEYAHQKVGARK